MKKIDLVFRSVNERCSKAALELAIKCIQPDQIHIFENVKPFSLAVRQSLDLEYKCDYVVFMDADCLILEDMRNYIEQTDKHFIDCFVLDKFRGHIHCGVHITSIQLVHEMKDVIIPEYDFRYVLRPESRTRHLALKKNAWLKHFDSFYILHDYLQYYKDIFAKYVLRELRSRKAHSRQKLEYWQGIWKKNIEDLDFQVALAAVEYSRTHIRDDLNYDSTRAIIESLPKISEEQMKILGIAEKNTNNIDEQIEQLKQIKGAKLTRLEVKKTIKANKSDSGNSKIFGIGLSRTGTKSLTRALGMMGYEIVHYPNDEATFRELVNGFEALDVLRQNEGITDITAAAIYQQLDLCYPDSRFILTIRDKDKWLDAMERHWKDKPVFRADRKYDYKLELRKFLRASVYGCYAFNRTRLSIVYDNYLANVKRYFANSPEKLLILDIQGGDGFEKLCRFLNHPVINQPFPNVKSKSALKG